MKRKIRYAMFGALICVALVLFADYFRKSSINFDFTFLFLQAAFYILALISGIAAVVLFCLAIKARNSEKEAEKQAKIEESLSRKSAYNSDTYVPAHQTSISQNPVSSKPAAQPSVSFTIAMDQSDSSDGSCCVARPKSLKTVSEIKRFKNFVVLDTETTGLSRNSDHIIEIAMIKYENGVEVDRFSSLINPDVHIPSDATRVNGISDDDVANAPRIGDISVKISEFIGNNYVVGHNVSFDLAFLLRECGSDFSQDYIYYVDTIGLAKRIFPDMPDYKLITLIAKLDIAQNQEHRAMSDAEYTLEVLRKCFNKFIGDEESKKVSQESQIIGCEKSPLFSKKIVFTGGFEFDREYLTKMVNEVGALHRTSVSSKTDYVVLGDMEHYGGDTYKHKSAREINENGGNIQIVSFNTFLSIVNSAKEKMQ